MKISVFSGANDPSYALPMVKSLLDKELLVDFIGNDQMQVAEVFRHPNVNYLNFRGCQDESVIISKKIARILLYYIRLIKYAFLTKTKIFHVLWLNKFELFDRTALNIYFRILGKKIIFTAHNINQSQRDGNDNFLNKVTLWVHYHLMHHIFVHTNKMKEQLIKEFNVKIKNITVIPFGLNTVIPQTKLSVQQAREKLGIQSNQKPLLFFGQIAPYKGLHLFIKALYIAKKNFPDVCVIVAGKSKEGFGHYLQTVQELIRTLNLKDSVILHDHFISDEEVEIYFKAADALVLPYVVIFQSGVPFLGFNFGLPIIATDVGELKDDVIDNVTGFICRPQDPEDLAQKICDYFRSDLYNNLSESKKKIIEYARKTHSWEIVAEKLTDVYNNLNPI